MQTTPHNTITYAMFCLTLLGLTTVIACGEDDAVSLGVGASCTEDSECGEENQSCLTQFKGGYCSVEKCRADAECPDGSRCVTHDDGANYCFLICTDKSQCNTDRNAEEEANCSSSVTFVEEGDNDKACVPPTGSSSD